MIEYTLKDAVAKAFDVKDVPEFKDMRPVRQAQEWLKSKGVDTRYDKHQVRAGVVVFQRGGGVLFGIIDDAAKSELPRNAVVIGSLSIDKTKESSEIKPKSTKKAQKSLKTEETEE